MRRTKPDRNCSRCGKPYYRANRMRLWTKTNPGHRDGWGRDDLKLCVNCLTQESARSAARIVSARIVSIDMRRRKAS